MWLALLKGLGMLRVKMYVPVFILPLANLTCAPQRACPGGRTICRLTVHQSARLTHLALISQNDRWIIHNVAKNTQLPSTAC